MELTIGIIIVFVVLGYFHLNGKIKEVSKRVEDTKPIYTVKDDEGNILLKNSKGETILEL